jgi:3-oxoacyl-[acyl-carrier protein] reductase
VAAFQAKGVKAFGAAVDVADKAGIENFVRESAKALGGLDILVANVSAFAVEDNEDAWRKAFDTDMMHMVRAANAALPMLEQSEHPAIVIISSVSGREVDSTGPPTAPSRRHSFTMRKASPSNWRRR